MAEISVALVSEQEVLRMHRDLEQSRLAEATEQVCPTFCMCVCVRACV